MQNAFHEKTEFQGDIKDRLALADQIQKLIGSAKGKIDERRSATRYSFSEFVDCVLLEEDYRRTKKKFVARAQDVSTGGIGLIHNARIEKGRLIAMHLPSTSLGLTIVGQVQWCQPKDHFQTFFLLGIRFLTR